MLTVFMVSWLIGVVCLFVALQFSPPRWSAAAISGALLTAVESSTVYVLPPLSVLLIWAVVRGALSAAIASTVAFIWIALTVAWWALSFDPIPWNGAIRNIVILLPGTLVPALAFYLLLSRR
jgi:hypothetical protein